MPENPRPSTSDIPMSPPPAPPRPGSAGLRREGGEVSTHQMITDERLLKFIATRDAKILKSEPWNPDWFKNLLEELCSNGVVKVGGRSSCGGTTDPTWTQFVMWNEIIRKARKLGYQISETNIKHKNAWASRAGGFWDEREYRISCGSDDRAKGWQ